MSSDSDDEYVAQFNQLLAETHFENEALLEELMEEDCIEEISDGIPTMQMALENMKILHNPPRAKRGGSKKGRRYTYRNHVRTHKRLVKNFFAENCTFNEDQFKLRFRLRKPMFDRIYDVVKGHPLFIQKYDAAKKPGIHPLVKVTIALRFLAYGSAVDALDETFYVGNQTAFNAIADFCIAMNELFGATYLRTPNNNDMEMILNDSDERGWPGCLGSLDCTTWRWEMCPIAWVGQYIGKERKACVQIECVCGHDGWIWNHVFGLAGGMNDLSVLEHSNLFKEYCSGKQPPVNFVVNGKPYNLGYYLCDGIYQEWGSLINAIPTPNGREQKYFTTKQESTRKDIECVFGKLKKKWHVLVRPSRFHNTKIMGDIVNTCIILHNMIIHGRCKYKERDYVPDQVPREELYPEGSVEYNERMQYCRNVAVGKTLKKDLVAHCWNRRDLD